MKKKNCLKNYKKEVLRQENPYEQWILQNESQNIEEEEDRILLLAIPMESVDASFSLHGIKEEIVVFFSAKGEVAPFAYASIKRYFLEHSQTDFLYADEDVIMQETGKRLHPWFKPEYGPDTLLSTFYIGHLFAIRVDKFKNIRFKCAQDYRINIYDFVLKAVEVTRGISHLPKVLFHQYTKQELIGTESIFDEIKIEACERRKMKAVIAKSEIKVQNPEKLATSDAIVTQKMELNTITYDIQNKPLVSVIIPSKDHAEVLEKCIASFMKYTSYPNIEFIIVDNGSRKEQRDKIIEFLAPLFDDQSEGGRKLNCYYDYETENFNFARMCNRGVRRARGEYFLFLNDDIEVITPEWLEKMLGQAQLPHVGAVGAKLLYPEEKRIQHVGITNMGIGPAHKLNGFPDTQIYQHGENCLTLNKLAVTAACLMVSRDKYAEAGGFPEEFPVAYNDVAFCFALIRKGYWNVIRNDAVLLHHESLSRGLDITTDKEERLEKEKALLYKKYPEWEKKDRFYNPNWVQEKKDTDYTCNFMYEYENPALEGWIQEGNVQKTTNWTKQQPKHKLLRKLFRTDALMFHIDCVQEKKGQELAGEQVFYYTYAQKTKYDSVEIEGWAALKGIDNSRYEMRCLLKAEDGKIYECDAFPKLRRDVEEIMQPTKAKNVALSGFVARFQNDKIAPGIYHFGVTAKSKINGKYKFTTWNEQNCLFFLKK